MPVVAIPNALIGAAGEYLVAAELSRRGWLATVTIKNAPGTDVLAQHSQTKRLVAIQAKTSSGGGSWRLNIGEETPTALDNEWVALVSLGGTVGAPRFWVMPRNHVAAYVWVAHRQWLMGVKADGTSRKDSAIRSIAAADISGYEGRWEWLDDPTTAVPYSLLPEWLHEGVRDARIGLRSDHPDAERLGAVVVSPP